MVDRTSDEKIRAILNILVRLTQGGRLEWHAENSGYTSLNSPTKYVASLTTTSVFVWSRDGDGLPPFRLEITNSQGEPVEEVYSENSDGWSDHTELMTDLYRAAKRQALNTDAVLDQLLGELQEKGEDPF